MAENLNLVVLHDTNRNEDVLPITHEDAVLDADGKSIGTKFTELDSKVDERTIVEEEITLTLIDGWATTTTWTKNNYYNKHAVIPVDSIRGSISIKAHATNGGRYGFLSSYPSTITNNSTVAWCSGTGRNDIAAGETVTVMKTDFPQSCQYVYIGVANTTASVTNNNYLPQAVNLLSYSKNAISDIKSKIVSIEEEITVIDTSTNIIAEQTAIKGWPGSNPGWVSDSDNYKGYFITVNAGDNYRIKANAERNTKVVMLPDSSHTKNSIPNILFSYYIEANTIIEVKVPYGATCMWVDAVYGGNNTSPQYIYAAQPIKDAVYKCEERITPLEDALVETEVEARVLRAYTSSCYIMADSSDANYGNVIDYGNADYACTPFIDISGYNKFSVRTLSSANQKKAGTVVYDANKVPIAGYYQSRSSGSGSYTAEGTLPENAAYIRVSSWSGSFAGDNVVLHLWDTLKEYTLRKTADFEDRLSELESNIPAGATMYDYVGEKIVLDTPKYAGGSIMGLSLTGTGQGGAVFGDYYFVGTNGNAYINVFNLSTKTKLTAISLAAVDITNAHANTLAFSNQYHTDGDGFPILYICSGYALDGNTKMYGYRIVNENNVWSATLVHTITLAASTWTEGVIDNSRQKLWIKKSGGWYCVDMPQYSNGDATIDLSIATPEFSSPLYEGSAQGHLFYNDKIYFASGIPDNENVSKLYVLNTKTGKYDSMVDLRSVSGNNEPENVFVYNGYLHVGYRNTIFRLYFN